MYEKQFHSIDLSEKSVLVTGGAGFIGSNLVEYLIKYNVGKVRVLDNLSTGFLENLKEFLKDESFEFIEGDIRDLNTCQKACNGMDYVLHQAALGSVPRSINDPITTNEVNIAGYLNILVAARDQKVNRVVYAASSSTYGDSKDLPKIEDNIGKPLSPYAVTKYVNELYADIFNKVYGLETIGLRYFNVFGPKQSPNGEYAAVIPLFIKAALENTSPFINGNGEQTRDFTFVENAIQANIKAMLIEDPLATNEVYNVACGDRTSLNTLWSLINSILNVDIPATYRNPRNGDISDSLANIEKIKQYLNYEPTVRLESGLKILMKK
jgi:UDP-N-acetylglucosamine/UDP-N-acetylgalactosamine 4-epimerase